MDGTIIAGKAQRLGWFGVAVSALIAVIVALGGIPDADAAAAATKPTAKAGKLDGEGRQADREARQADRQANQAAAVPAEAAKQAKQAEIAKLENELYALQVKQANFAAVKVARKLYELQRDDRPGVARDPAPQADPRRHPGTRRRRRPDHDLQELLAHAEKKHGPDSREVFTR